MESNTGSFDGLDDYVDLGSIGSGNSLMLNGSPLTITAWVNKVGTGGTAQRIVDKSDGESGQNGYYFGLEATTQNELRLGIDGTDYADTSFTIPNNEWHHIAVVADSSAMTRQFYLDGAPVGTEISIISLPPNFQVDMHIGSWYSSERELKGKLADVRIFNQALTQEQINEIYQGSLSLTGVDPVGWWPLAEGGSPTYAYDVSGNENHGTINGMTYSTDNDVFHYNIQKGFTDSSGVKIPALADGSADASGGAISNPAGYWHNDAETKFVNCLAGETWNSTTQTGCSLAPALWQADYLNETIPLTNGAGFLGTIFAGNVETNISKAIGFAEILATMGDKGYYTAEVIDGTKRKEDFQVP